MKTLVVQKLLDYVKICKKEKIIINKNAGFKLFRCHNREISIIDEFNIIYDGPIEHRKTPIEILAVYNVTAALSPSVVYTSVANLYNVYYNTSQLVK